MDFLRSVLDLFLACWTVGIRRLTGPALVPGWGLIYEAGVEFLRRMTLRSHQVTDVRRQRKVANSLWIPTFMSLFSSIRSIQFDQVPARLIVPERAKRHRKVLYLHGGAYVFYVSMHDRLVIPFSQAARAISIVPEYRLAPEYPFPAALEDSLAAYQWLLRDGTDPDQLVLAGDSAGGGLAVALLIRLRELGLPMPRLTLLISPWVDLSCTGDSLERNRRFDWITREVSLQMARYYLPDGNLTEPLASPLYANLRGLPPMYIQAGQAEVLHDQIHAFADRAREQGVDILLEMYPGMVHEFQAFDRYTPQSRAALKRIGQVIDHRLDKNTW